MTNLITIIADIQLNGTQIFAIILLVIFCFTSIGIAVAYITGRQQYLDYHNQLLVELQDDAQETIREFVSLFGLHQWKRLDLITIYHEHRGRGSQIKDTIWVSNEEYDLETEMIIFGTRFRVVLHGHTKITYFNLDFGKSYTFDCRAFARAHKYDTEDNGTLVLPCEYN